MRPAPRVTLYFGENYDLDRSTTPAACRRTTMGAALRSLWASDERVLELPEPLWLRFLPRWLVLATAWKLRALRGVREREVVFFAIENNALDVLLPRFVGRHALLRRCAVGGLRTVLGRLVSRCAFGTDVSAETYSSVVSSRTAQRVIPDLLHAAAPAAKVPGTVAFVGAMERRKGVSELMRAWPAVERETDATLTLIGDGAMAPEVRRWAAERPASRAFRGPLPRAEALQVLATTTVLVAPSVPDGRWREQVGRPIQEALAAGATVVTTDQSGLAAFLRRHGHRVLRLEQLEEGLAAEIAGALARPLDPDAVRGALPVRDGRLEADAWLHA